MNGGSEEPLPAILRCLAEIEACRENLRSGDGFGATLGECDWLAELHRLLDEVKKWTR